MITTKVNKEIERRAWLVPGQPESVSSVLTLTIKISKFSLKLTLIYLSALKHLRT